MLNEILISLKMFHFNFLLMIFAIFLSCIVLYKDFSLLKKIATT